jgi:hypothetical protein
MKRLLTLASTGLFATGLAVLPVTVFAQPGPTPGTDAKPGTAAHAMTNDTKASDAKMGDAKTGDAKMGDAKAVTGHKDSGATKDAAKVTGAKLGSAPASGTAKTAGSHDKGA